MDGIWTWGVGVNNHYVGRNSVGAQQYAIITTHTYFKPHLHGEKCDFSKKRASDTTALGKEAYKLRQSPASQLENDRDYFDRYQFNMYSAIFVQRQLF